MNSRILSLWLARVALLTVFFFNVLCAGEFIIRPAVYAPSFEVSGVPGEALVRGMGILFLMWNVTYPLAMWHPWRYRWLVLIIICQQTVGLAGETWMLLALPSGHEILARSAQRFIVYDGGGLALFVVTFALMWFVRCCPAKSRVDGTGDETAPPRADASPR